MSKSGDRDQADRTSHRHEGKPKEAGDASGKSTRSASKGGDRDSYYKETDAETWRKRVIRRDRELYDMMGRLAALEAIVKGGEPRGEGGSRKSGKKRGEDDRKGRMDSAEPKRYKETSRHERGRPGENLVEWMARREGGGCNDSVYMPLSPFVPEIVGLKMPRNYNTPKFTTYDGKSDPFAHIRQFRNSMSCWDADDRLWCKMFPSSLGDLGSEWFEKLAAGSVYSFDQIAGMFTQRFKTNQKQPKRIDALQTMMKGAGEDLRDYAKRYWDTFNSIPEIAESSAIASFKNGFHVDDELRKSIVIDLPKTMGELMERIEKYACLEDDRRMEAMLATRRGAKGSFPKKDSYPSSSAYEEKEYQKPGFKVQPMTGVNAAFTVPIERILEDIKDKPFYRPPRKVDGEFFGKALNVRCNYHETEGHQTDRCAALRKFLEELVQQGYLSEFVDHSGVYDVSAKKKEDNRPRGKQVAEPKGGRPVINVIHGGIRLTDSESRGQIRSVCHVQKVNETEPKKQKVQHRAGSTEF